jgi:hypothetical protein
VFFPFYPLTAFSLSVSASSKGLSAVHPSIQKLVDSLTSAPDDAALVKSLKSLHTLGKNGIVLPLFPPKLSCHQLDGLMRSPTEKNRQQIFIAGSLNALIDVRTLSGYWVPTFPCTLAR